MSAPNEKNIPVLFQWGELFIVTGQQFQMKLRWSVKKMKVMEVQVIKYNLNILYSKFVSLIQAVLKNL